MAEIMVRAETVASSASIDRACSEMLRRQFSCMPVVDEERLVGIVTSTDLLRFTVGLLEGEARERREGQRVRDIMTNRPITTIAPSASLGAAWRLMQAQRIRHLPVVEDDDVLLGIVSDRDLLPVGRRFLLSDEGPSMVVADAMSKRVWTVSGERPAVEAAHRLLRLRIGALPVVRQGRLQGILSVSDFMYFMLSRI
jgi:CBS domain-containing protein